jgi:hypothetical protein
MKGTINIHFTDNDAPFVIAKLQQWTEFLHATGIDARFTVSDDDPPAADLWQALNESILNPEQANQSEVGDEQ